MPARLIVVGIDAANPDLIRSWAADGTLPNLGRLFRTGMSGTVLTAEGFFSSIWPCFYTGCSPAEHGFHYQSQLRPGTYLLENLEARDLSRREPFWRALSRAGKRVAILDVPLVSLDSSVNGVHMIEWGGHDAVFGFASHPAEIGEQILASEGTHPQPSVCDDIRRTVQDYQSFVEALEQGARKRARFVRRILAQEEWDLCLHVFSEAHCAGHQCWHLHDPSHPAYDASIAEELGDPLKRVYAAIDHALGEILDDAREASVMVFSGHGMRHWYGAHFLLLDILVCLGVTARAPSTLMQLAERAAHTGWRALPNAVRQRLKLLLRRSAPAAGWGSPPNQVSAPIPLPGVNAAASLCFPLSNGLAATGIRLNVEGREPAGRIAQGAPVRAFEDNLIRDLLQIIDERSGRPLIRTVLRTRDLYAGAALEALPDLLVEWSDEIATGSTVVGPGTGAVVRAQSARIGVVEGRNEYCRTGEHRVEGFVVAAGSNIPHGTLANSISIMDLAPTLAAQLGVALHGIDGKVIDSLKGGAIGSDVVEFG